MNKFNELEKLTVTLNGREAYEVMNYIEHLVRLVRVFPYPDDWENGIAGYENLVIKCKEVLEVSDRLAKEAEIKHAERRIGILRRSLDG